MGKKSVYSMVLVVVLVGVLGITFDVHRVEASGPIYIRADGSVEGTTFIVSSDNVTYVFTADINDCDIMYVQRSNIIVDGNGHVLNSSGIDAEVGITVESVNNVTIQNVSIHNFPTGIYLFDAANNTISGNNVTNNNVGISINQSGNNTVSGNTVTGNNQRGIHLYSSSNYNSISENNITANTYDGIYLEWSSSNNVSGNYIAENSRYGICLTYCSNNTLSGNNITANNNVGIYLDESSNNVISGNNIKDSPNEHICLLYSSNNNTISGNTLTNSTADVGIYVYACSLNTFSGNNITDNADSGIRLDSSSDSTISENNISKNLNGVYLWYSSNITVSGNNITGNSLDGILLISSNENAILSNEFYSNQDAGINLQSSSDNTIQKNTNFSGYDSQYGIILWVGSDRNTVSENVLSPFWRGIAMGYSDGNRILNNIVSNTHDSGIQIQQICNNTIIANNMVSNSSLYGISIMSDSEATRYNVIQDNNITHNLIGIYIFRLSGNIIYHNNFVDNTNQTSISSSTNIWDDGYPSGGNYWSDYTDVDQYSGSYQNETGSDKIWDHPYVINADNEDRYPFTGTWAWDTEPPSIGTVSQNPEVPDDGETVTVTVDVTDAESGVRNVTLSYTTDGGTTWHNITMDNTEGDTYQGEIPGFEADTNVQYKIIAYDNADNPAVEDNTGEYYVYTVIPEFPSPIILPLFMFLALIVVVLTKKNRRKATAKTT